jgi:hypothetical protein
LYRSKNGDLTLMLFSLEKTPLDYINRAEYENNNNISPGRKRVSWEHGFISIQDSAETPLKGDHFPNCPVSSRALNFSLLRDLLQGCRKSHTKCIPQELPLIPGFSLINCHSRSIVAASEIGPSIPEFVALSYVWGSCQDRGPLRRPSIPKTIDDAIAVTLKIRYKYLWVDRYCIDEEKVEERHAQIQAMDAIYGSAQVTLIAAAGLDPHHGLPGVGNHRHSNQRRMYIGNRESIWTLECPSFVVQDSQWNTRAWTYQEGLLSHRRIVFTDQQFYFQCNQVCACESQPYPRAYRGNVGFPLFLFPDLGDELNAFRADSYSATKTFADLLLSYQRRNMSYDEDILNAFMGILKRMTTSPGSIYSFVWGMPIFTKHMNVSEKRSVNSGNGYKFDQKLMRGFLTSLAIIMPPDMERRHGFPSWSWVGWKPKTPSGMGWTYVMNKDGPTTACFDPESVTLHNRDGIQLSWESVVRNGNESLLDGKNLSHRITIRCWMLRLTTRFSEREGITEKAIAYQRNDEEFQNYIREGHRYEKRDVDGRDSDGYDRNGNKLSDVNTSGTYRHDEVQMKPTRPPSRDGETDFVEGRVIQQQRQALACIQSTSGKRRYEIPIVQNDSTFDPERSETCGILYGSNHYFVMIVRHKGQGIWERVGSFQTPGGSEMEDFDFDNMYFMSEPYMAWREFCCKSFPSCKHSCLMRGEITLE